MEKICNNCSFMELKKIRDGYSAYCCMAHTIVKGGTKYTDPKCANTIGAILLLPKCIATS